MQREALSEVGSTGYVIFMVVVNRVEEEEVANQKQNQLFGDRRGTSKKKK